MKHSAILFSLLVGCGGSFADECGGDFQHSQLLTGPEPGHCMVVEIDPGSSGEVGVDDACPVGRCAVIQDGESFRIWKNTIAGDPEFSTAEFALQRGECILTCE